MEEVFGDLKAITEKLNECSAMVNISSLEYDLYIG